MPKKQILYTCKWCNKLHPTSKKNAISHEKYCFKNPKNKACLTCKYFKRRRRVNEESEYIAGDIYECSKLDLMYYRKHDTYFINKQLSSGLILITQNEIDYTFNAKVKPIFPKSNCDDWKRKIK